jgi:hypothetical protein
VFFHVQGVQPSFILVVQKNNKLVTYNAQAYSVKCVYRTGERTVSAGHDLSIYTTAGTIGEVGPPPVCTMKIVTTTGGDVDAAQLGEPLVLRVEVTPTSIYSGFARNCVAKTTNDAEVENTYKVTDENGCATDPSVFAEWELDRDTNFLMAQFNAFKFPSGSNSIKFNCAVRVCFGACQSVRDKRPIKIR